MEEIIYNVIFQIFLFILLIYIIGYVISLINRTFYKYTGGGMAVCLATGFIGTPIHELSHASMCLLFGHKIEDMKLFQTDDANGVLGYVSHSYNRKNPYHIIGNYFIGVAPIFMGAVVLYFLMKALIPMAFEEINASIEALVAVQENGITTDIIGMLFDVCVGAFVSMFTVDFSYKTVIFLVICLCIALHMNLSGADIKGSLGAIPIIIILLFAVNTALYYISYDLYLGYLGGVSFIGSYLLSLLALSLVFSFIILVIGLIFKIIFRR